ncbi:phage virion morphogenesis protein [Vibrio europaeus]|uniref:phage virion morphogenesis protein n=1 Tax=Vibrio europaeus TaxID=300876 RepID=UPI00233EEF77|nr:phage virion morphogenesis protein [Vibrio europaeus]MDC5753857.1 phage virion morphogenesis protein [Vibrio europaeus]MDC5776769.1 phage virion morphogenesis protein [Vibrio europaeus]MDC5796785.1 phage virion morphogenesis protein [Vibrio europaeus]MDC5801782.1 phage virion morphogenesis protein [Vibrio europaeus]MDC5815755.1 phage virion morphogenesis protein [Vibrio europaeus]
MSFSIHVKGGEELVHIERRIESLSERSNKRKLLNLIAAEVESQTHRRIRQDKTAPDGTPWEAWSDGHAKTRHGNQSLLMASGDLDDSIQSYIQGNRIHHGSDLPYAAVHQEGFSGAVNVPAHTRLTQQAFGKALAFPVYQNVSAHTRHLEMPQREYLGLGEQDEKELLTLIGDFYGDVFH